MSGIDKGKLDCVSAAGSRLDPNALPLLAALSPHGFPLQHMKAEFKI